MKNNNGIVCIGTISNNDYEKIKCIDYYKQFMVYPTYCLPDKKLNIESILEIIIDSKITRYRIIKTPHGKKIIYQGEIRIKVVYVAETDDQSVHSAHTSQHFYNFISLGENDHCDYDKLCENLCDKVIIDSYIEDIEPIKSDSRKIDFSVLILVTIKFCPYEG